MKGQNFRILISEQQIKDKISELGKTITEDYKDKNLLLISVLKGSFIFMSDLARSIKLDLKIDFLSVSSYSGTTSTGVVRILNDLSIPIIGYDILLVEDILDSGRTLAYITSILKERKPNSIEVCTLLDKPSRRVVDVDVKYSGFSIPDEFVVGYGLDYNEDYRNLRDIAVVS